MALAVGIPETMPYRSEILTVTFAVVAFSVFVQGMTFTPVMRYLGELPNSNAKN